MDVIDEDDLALQRRWLRIGVGVLAAICLIVGLTIAVSCIAYRRNESFGTIWADKTPPKIRRCGREWNNSGIEQFNVQVPPGQAQVGTTPGGAPILSLGRGCPDTTTVIWVRINTDRSVAYELSGGP